MSYFNYQDKVNEKSQDLFAPNGKYGYHISINHPKILKRWQRFCVEWDSNDNVERLDEETWQITTTEGTYLSSKPWDYTERRKQFELFIISDPELRTDFENEIAKYGDFFECAKGIKLDKLYSYWERLNGENDV